MKLKSISLPFLETSFEPEMRRISDLAFRSAEHLIREAPERISPIADPDRWKSFVRQVHRGFVSAQAAVVRELLQLDGGTSAIRKQKELALRKVDASFARRAADR